MRFRRVRGNAPRLVGACCAVASLWSPLYAAQPDSTTSYPNRPIRIVVPFAPGGNIDVTARIVAPGLSEALGQPVVVENRGGAGSRIGTTLVAKSPPDGYTLLLGSSGSLAVQPAFHDDPGYHPRDFVYTSSISLTPIALVTHPAVPARTLKALIALAKAQPGTLLMGSAGQGSNTHLTGEYFQ